MKTLDRIRVKGSLLYNERPALKKVRGFWIELLEVPEFTEGVVLSVEPTTNTAVVRLEGYGFPLKMYIVDLEPLNLAAS